MSNIPCNCGRVVPDGEHHCWIHHLDEHPVGAYIVCGKCWHVYRTAGELEAAHVAAGSEPIAGGAIFSCPECVHDF